MSNNLRIIHELMNEEEEEAHVILAMADAAYQYHQHHLTNMVSCHNGSVINHRMFNRNREEGHARLYHDYFSDTPTYPEESFRRRFRMRRSLFLRIQEAVTVHDNYFTQRNDAVGVRGLSSLQKMTAALRMLAYGTPADAIDDYVRIGESTAIESLKKFVKAIVEIFGEEYLRRPTNEDVAKLLMDNKRRGFPGMLGSIDCMHWKWKKLPICMARYVYR
ncbi:hypothetical protein OROMI_008281 [Orobanche minor]